MIVIDGGVAKWVLFLLRYRQYPRSIFTGIEFVITTPSKGNMNRKWHLSVADVVLIMKTEERRKERNKSVVSLSLPYLIISVLTKWGSNQGGKKAQKRHKHVCHHCHTNSSCEHHFISRQRNRIREREPK